MFNVFSPYSKDPSDIANSFMHLTNVAVQKHSDQYDTNVKLNNKFFFYLVYNKLHF